MQWDVMSWGYWDYDGSATAAPLVSAYKAATGSRHLAHICERYLIHPILVGGPSTTPTASSRRSSMVQALRAGRMFGESGMV